MPDTIASIIHVPHSRSMDEGRVQEWLSAAEYVIRLPEISSALSSGDNTLAVIPDDVYLMNLHFRCKTRFGNDSHEPLFPHVTFGNSSSPDTLGILPAVYFQDTTFSGVLPLNYYSSAGWTLTVDVTNLNSATATNLNDANFGQGAMELWLTYRAQAPKIGPMQGVTAR